MFVCESQQSFFVVFCVVRIVYKFRFGPVIKEVTKNGDQWKEGDKVSCLW
jgi:hypothetical protein